LSSLEQMVESGVDLTLVAIAANTVKVLDPKDVAIRTALASLYIVAVERLEAGPPGRAEAGQWVGT
jgi:hypothetical protein